MPAGLPFFGLTMQKLGTENDNIIMKRTVVIKIADDLREALLRLFVEVGDGDTSSEDSIVWMLGGQICCSFRCQVLLEISATRIAGETRGHTSSSTVVTPWYTPEITFFVILQPTSVSTHRTRPKQFLTLWDRRAQTIHSKAC